MATFLFVEDELDDLPETVRDRLKEKYGLYSLDCPVTEVIEDVAGLNSALDKTRDEKKSLQKTQFTIRESLGLDDKGDIRPAIDALKKGATETSVVKRELVDANMAKEIAEADGNVHALPAIVRERMKWSDKLGRYIVPAEDGEPLVKDDGTMKTVADVVADMKKNKSHFGAFFKATDHSSGGSDSTSGAGGAPKNDAPDGLPPSSTRRSAMSREQKIAILNSGGQEALDRYPL